MMNVGGNVWADEKPAVEETEGNDEQKPSEDEINKRINPKYTIQHYFWFPKVEMIPDPHGEDVATEDNKVGDVDQLGIINTNNLHNAGSENNPVEEGETFGNGNLPKNGETPSMVKVTMEITETLEESESTEKAEGSKVVSKGKVKTTPVLTKMFMDEEVHFLDKPRMIYMNRLYNGEGDYNKNYALEEVWVYQPDKKPIKKPDELTKDDFDIYIAPLNESGRHDPSKFVFTNNRKNENLPINTGVDYPKENGAFKADRYTILIQEGTVVRLVFRTTEGREPIDGVKFFDYDISDGNIYRSMEDARNQTNKVATSSQNDTETWYSNTVKKGINSHELLSQGEEAAGKAIYAFGNNNTGTTLGDQSWGTGNEKLNINQANKKDDGVPDVVFGMVTGLSPEGTLVWHDNIKAPAIFDQNHEITGKKNYTNNNFKLIFHREGGTYTLSGVQYDGKDIASAQDLETFTRREYRAYGGGANKVIWSNNFWPMDGKYLNPEGEYEFIVPSYGTDQHDLKFGMGAEEGKYYIPGSTGTSINHNKKRKYIREGSDDYNWFPIADDAIDHNAYFGMTFDVDFVVDPGYVAPLRYFFYGDDDLWVFLSEIDEDGNIVKDASGRATTRLIADIGGVHSSIGEYVDLWDYIKPIEYKTNNVANKPKKYRLSFYYTERGASGSTCYMRFSVPFKSLQVDPIVFDSLLKIEKKVESQNSTEAFDKDKEFKFTLHLYNDEKDEDGNPIVELENQYPYERYDKNGTAIDKSMDTMTTGSTFVLKDGEYIIIKDLPKGTTYKVVEESESDSGIFTTFCVGSTKIDEVFGKDITIGTEAKGDSEGTNYAKFINSLNPGILTLEKKLSDDLTPDDTEFNFNIKLERENVSFIEQPWLHYTKVEEDGKSQFVWKEAVSQCENGQFMLSLKAGEKAMLYNLPEDTHYTISEALNDNYCLEKVTINSIEASDIQKIEGDIRKLGDGTCPEVKVVFTNTLKSSELKIAKLQTRTRDKETTEKTEKTLSVEEGDIVTYYIQVKNTGDKKAEGVVIRDKIPVDANGENRLGLIKINNGGRAFDENGNETTDLGKAESVTWIVDVPAGSQNEPGVTEVSFEVEVPPIKSSTSWKNIATIVRDPEKPEDPEDPKTDPVYIVPTLRIEKEQSVLNKSGRTKDPLKVEPGDEVTYYLTVSNPSEGTAREVTVTDRLPLDDSKRYRLTLKDEESIKGDILKADGTVKRQIGGHKWRESDKETPRLTDHKADEHTIVWDEFELEPGESATLRFTAIVPDGGEHWVNIGYLSYTPERAPNDPNVPKPTVPEPSNKVEISTEPKDSEEVSELTVSKAQARTRGEETTEKTEKTLSVEEGDIVTYYIQVKNTGDKKAEGVVIRDKIPVDANGENRLGLIKINNGGRAFDENGNETTDLGKAESVTWIVDVPAGSQNEPGVTEVSFEVEVPPIKSSTSWKNIATIVRDPEKPEDPEDPKTDPVYIVPTLRIEKEQAVLNKSEKTKDPLKVEPGDKVTYYLTITNTSDATAFDVDVKDTVPNGLILVEDSIRGGESHDLNGREIIWHLGDLASGASQVVEFTVIVPTEGSRWINGASTSYIPPDPEDPDKPGPEEDRTPDIPSNEVEIEKSEIRIRKTQYVGDNGDQATEGLLSVKPGDVITYRLTVTNESDGEATDVIVTDQIPEGLTLVNGSISDGGTVGSDDIITWKLGTLGGGESKTVQFKATVPQVDEAAIWRNIAYVTSGNPDPDPEEDPKTPSNPVEAVPGITIEKTQQRNGEGEPTKELLHVKKDDRVTYYLTITNTSETTAFDVDVKDTVPKDNAGNELILVEDSIRGGESHDLNGREIIWHLGDLASGASQVVEFTVIVPTEGSRWINGASTSYIPPDPEDPDKPGPEEDRTPDIPSNEVEIEKSEIRIRKTQYVGDNGDQATEGLLSVKPGDVITYRLTVTNESDGEATDVIVTDQIPEGLTLVNGSISDGGTVGSDDVITWKIGTLGGGESKTVQFKAAVPQVDEAAIWRNIAYVTSGNPDPDPEEDPKTPSNPVEAVPGISIEKTQQVNGRGEPTKETLHVQKDDEVTYYLTVTNTSDAKAFDVIVTDEIPEDSAGNRLELIEDSIEGGESHAVSGRVITWNVGDLDVGESQTLSFTVRVPSDGSRWRNMATTSYVPGDPDDPEKPGPEGDRTPDIPSNEVEIEAGTTRIQLRARKVLNGADLVNGQFTFRIQGIQAEILEETDSETQSPETTQKPGEAGDTGENGGTTDATPSNAEREDGETGSSRGIVSGLIRPGGKTITSQVMLQAQTLTKVEGLRAGNHDVPMPSENTATNNEDGEIVFGEIEYSRPGTYTYKITEVKETRRGYTFDTTEYTVEVVVTRDDMTGELMARVNIVKPEGAEEILFTNRYRRPSSGGGKPSGGGGSNPQPGPGTDPSPDPTPENPDTPTPENPENPQPTPDTPALPDPNDPNSPPTVTIEENGVPRTYVKVWDPVNEEFIYIPEEDVPLFGLLPKTGEEERRRRLGVILVMSLAGIGTLMTMEEWRRRKREREIK